jgi:methyl-accepting chemotaxis protein
MASVENGLSSGTVERFAFKNSLGIRTIAGAVVMAGLGTAVAGHLLLETMRARYEASILSEASRTLSELSRATIEMSLERSVSQLALSLPTPIAPALRGLLDTQRAKADAGLDRASAAAVTLASTSRGSTFVADLRAHRDRLSAIRREVDRLVTTGQDARPQDRTASLVANLKATVSGIQGTRQLLRGGGFSVPTEVVIAERIRDHAWTIREYGGRERTHLMLSVALARPLTALERREIDSLRPVVEGAWAEIGGLASHPSVSDRLRRAVDTVARGYFGSYERTRAGLLDDLGVARPTFDALFAETATVLDEVTALSAHAADEIQSIWSQRATSQTWLLVVEGIAAVTFVLVAAAMITTTRRSFRRLDRLRGAMAGIADGRLNTDVPDVASPDEIGRMADAVMTLRENSRAAVSASEIRRAERAERETRQQAVAGAVTEFESAARDMVRALTTAATDLTAAADGMSQTAQETQSRVQIAGSASETTRANVQAVAAAGQQLAASINEIGRLVAGSADLAGRAVQKATETDRRVQILAEAASSIGVVVKLINEIAAQTNLLALNATIEAARAGEAGRGFAVVASEVKNLAAQTGRATDEIAAKISEMSNATQQTVEAIQDIGTTIREISMIASSISAATDEQTAAAEEIARNVEQAVEATSMVAQSVAEVTRSASATGVSAQEVRKSAGTLDARAKDLRGRVDAFLGAVRSG